jgi:hypothetical protein
MSPLMSPFIKIVVVISLCLLPAMASANGFKRPFHACPHSYSYVTPNSNSVPELDANSGAAALCLLLGSVAVLSGRRRSR